MAFLKAVLIGEVKKYGDKNAKDSLNKVWETAMFKVAQEGEVFANELGFVGDNVADTRHHGSIDKAIFANSFENYEFWEKFLGFKNLPFGAMGENLTISGLNESSVCVGDVHKMGSLILEVSEPRKPCFKISKRWFKKDLAIEIFKTGLTGWYYRVLQSGSCKASDKVEILKKDSSVLSILDINRLFYAPKKYENLLEKFMNSKISQKWKDDINSRLKNTYDTGYMNEL